MISKGFYEALEAISIERALEMDQILEKVEVALAVACKNNDVPYKGTIKIEADPEKKEIKFYNYYYVVDRKFENAEVTLLSDVIKASKLNLGQKSSLIQKLTE